MQEKENGLNRNLKQKDKKSKKPGLYNIRSLERTAIRSSRGFTKGIKG